MFLTNTLGTLLVANDEIPFAFLGPVETKIYNYSE